MHTGNTRVRPVFFALLMGVVGARAQAAPRASLPHAAQVVNMAKTAKSVVIAKSQTPPRKRMGKTSKMDKMIVYIGTYTSGKSQSKGIYIYQMDTTTGTLTPAGYGPPTVDPSFLAVAPNHKYLFAANEISDFHGTKDGAVSAFAIAPKTGALTFLNQQPSAGSGPCFVATDSQGKNVLVANYGSGSVAVLPVGADGKLSAPSSSDQHEGRGGNPDRQDGPHAHSINLDTANRFAFAADLGNDKIYVYHFDAAKGKITPSTPAFASVAPGAGPRHFAFHPNGHYAYVINELNSTVTAFHYDAAKGELTTIESLSTLPDDFKDENSTAEVRVHPSGKFLYGSNRGHNSIAIFAIDSATGKLKAVGHQSTQGKTPRNFNIDPTGNFLLAANQASDSVVVFRIDPQTGQLTPTGQTLDVPAPACVKFLPLAH